MWKFLAILGLALSVANAALAQDGQSKKASLQQKMQKAEQVFKARDKDHDGKLSKEEFLGKVKDPERQKVLEARFKTMDTNGDGYVTFDEFKAYWASRAHAATTKTHGKKHQHQPAQAAIT